MQPSQSTHQLLKKALFGMQSQGQPLHQAEAVSRMQERRDQMAPGYRYTYQRPRPAAPVPLRGALSPQERENDRLVQSQIARNNQNPMTGINPHPATGLQAQRAAAGAGHHTVDSAGAVRYVQGNINTQAASVAPEQNQGYEQAKANLLKINPNLGVAGRTDNTQFINHLKTQYGDNYREQMQKDPRLLTEAYLGMNRGNQNQMKPNNLTLPKSAQTNATDFYSRAQEDSFRKAASLFGIPEEKTELYLCDLKSTKKASDQSLAFMNYMRKELLKLSAQTNNHTYSTQEIVKITESPENFQKAAMLEANMFFEGLSAALLKEGKDQSFLHGMLKQAEEFSEAIGATPANPSAELLGTLGAGAKNVINSIKTKGQDVLNALKGGTESTGKAVGDMGNSALNAAKETASNAAPQVAPAVEQAKKEVGTLFDKGTNFIKNITKPLTNEDDRHQIIPGMGNQFIGAAGGALLSALLGGQLGLKGPAAWLVPLLGGAAGYHYLPKLMNMWKDAPGTGVNATPAPVGNYYQRNPLVPVQVNQPDASNPQTSASPLAQQQQFNFNQKTI